MKREIEVKARVGNLDQLIQRLQDRGCVLGEPKIQDDTIYTQYDVFVEQRDTPPNVLRIRRQTRGDATKSIFTFKRNQANELDCIERETEITDPTALHDILNFLGYQSVVQVRKSRRSGQLGEYEVCVDQVDDLGDFIELEMISDADGEQAQSQLWRVLEELGVSPDDRVTQGYDTLLYNKLHA